MVGKDDILKYTIPQLLRWRVHKTGDKVALREKEFGYWNNYTWNDFYDRVRKIALGLEKMGLKKEDKLALIGDNIPEMLFMAIGAQSIGAISAGIYQTSLPDEIADLINYMDVTVVFCDDQEQVDKLVEVRDQIPQVRKVIYEDPRGMRDYRSDDWYIFIEDLYEMGAAAYAKNPEKYDALIDQASPDDVCHFCLTSGTTGLPKASMMTHKNYVNMGIQITKVDKLSDTDEYLSFLPFAWIGEQMNSFGVAKPAWRISRRSGLTLCLVRPESMKPYALKFGSRSMNLTGSTALFTENSLRSGRRPPAIE
jgi:long-chain acyl-CoA synthetase